MVVGYLEGYIMNADGKLIHNDKNKSVDITKTIQHLKNIEEKLKVLEVD